MFENQRNYIVDGKIIIKVPFDHIYHIIETGNIKSSCYAKTKSGYIAVYNSDGNALTKEFKRKRECVEWLTEQIGEV